MTAIQYVEQMFIDRWNDSSLDGQREPLDKLGRIDSDRKIRVHRESAQDLRKVNLSAFDSLMLRDGGVTEIQPQSFGWAEESTVSRVTVDIRTSGLGGAHNGRERLWGKRMDGNTSPTYGGLTGEVKRVCDEVRKGDKEFDLIVVREQNDLSAEMGGQVWRATTEIVLDVRAANIDPNP